jgi:hypothetical protein
MQSDRDITVADLEKIVNGQSYDGQAIREDDRSLISDEAFSDIKEQEKPSLAKSPLMRAAILGGLAMLVLIPIGLMFKGNMTIDSDMASTEKLTDENGNPIEPFSTEADEIAKLQLENSELKRNMGLASQSLNASELAELEKKSDSTTTSRTATPAASSNTRAANRPAATQAASRPVTAPVQSINYRPAEPVRPAYRSPVSEAPIQAQRNSPTSNQPAKIASTPTEIVDPFEMRDRLANLGNYGQPVELSAETDVAAIAPKNIVTPISRTEPAFTQNVAYRPAAADDDSVPVVEDDQYQKDVAAALGMQAEEFDQQTSSESAILPGEMFKAKIINGVSWSQGDRPEMALETIEDFATESGAVLIPKGTRIMATVSGADESGAVFTGVSQIYMDSALNIPEDALVIQAEDGSVLKADRNSQTSSGGGLDLGGIVWGSAVNAADNVIESDDSLMGDLVGGVGEAVLEDQRDRVDAREESRSVTATPQVGVWTLTPRNVQIFVARMISMEPEQDAEN